MVNHAQATRLLTAADQRRPSGPRLVAFFASMYYSALRPEEALNLRSSSIILPAKDDQWGEFKLYKAASHVGRAWTDSGEARDERNLKQRADGHVRRVPIPPSMVAILRRHLINFPALTGDSSTATTADHWRSVPTEGPGPPPAKKH